METLITHGRKQAFRRTEIKQSEKYLSLDQHEQQRAGMAEFLDVSRVTKVYQGAKGQEVVALDDVSLTIEDREIIALIGPSGCGKSTLLRMIAGLDQNFSGAINWARTPRPGRDIGFVFQEPALLPWRTVFRNVALGLEGKGQKKAVIADRVDNLLELVGLENFANSYPAELSGGMRQRVAIVRALAYNPQVLLMDEPFGALDAITRDGLQDELLSIWNQTHKTIVLVTHSVEEAAYLSDRVVVLSARPGRIKAIHPVPLPRERSKSTRLLSEFTKFVGLLRDELE
ncbi:ABC transporter ATP-binding protein [Arthrobacter pigmenti]